MALDLIGLGSAIVDFAPSNTGVPLSGVKSFIPYAGGSVSNILVAASRLGLKTGFLGCVGDDEFGIFVLNDFMKEGVDVSCVKKVTGFATGIAFYNVDKNGERHYIFYRFPGYSDPETMFFPEDLKEEYVAQTKMLHFSEAMLRKKQTRETVIKILVAAKRNGVKVSYDPNVREALWNNRDEFQQVQRKILGFTDIFLSTLKEADLIVGGNDVDKIIENILALGPSTVVVRKEQQYHIVDHGKKFIIPIFEVKAVDTSGAGDVFVAGFLNGLIKNQVLDRAIMLGSAAAAIKVMTPGTRGGLPSMYDVIKFLKEKGKVDL